MQLTPTQLSRGMMSPPGLGLVGWEDPEASPLGGSIQKIIRRSLFSRGKLNPVKSGLQPALPGLLSSAQLSFAYTVAMSEKVLLAFTIITTQDIFPDQ